MVDVKYPIQDWVKKYEQGSSTVTIAKEYKVSHTTVAKYVFMFTKKRPMEGETHTNWKGDKVSYEVLHEWAHRHKPKSIACENCGKSNCKLELSNISQKYLRDLNDFWWLCTRCHRDYDQNHLNLEPSHEAKRNRTHCNRGHLWSKNAVFWGSEKYRRCRQCALETTRRQWTKHKDRRNEARRLAKSYN